MKIRFGLTAPLALATALTIAACTGGLAIPAAPGGTGGQAGGGHGNECAAYPTLNVAASAQPSMPSDTSLLSEFPQQVAGQPISNASAVPFLAFLCSFSGQVALDQMRQSSSILGVDITNMSFGDFEATINGNTIKVTALRTPNQDASRLINNFGLFGAFAGISVAGSGLSDANVGGKNVKVSTNSDSTKSYLYAHGDTLFVIDSATDAEAAAILQALP